MKIVCESCGHAGEASDVQVREGTVFVSCAHCGRASALSGGTAGSSGKAGLQKGSTEGVEPVTAPAIESVPEGPRPPEAGLPPVKCPKCAHRQEDEYACHKCGLVFATVADGRRPWEEHMTPREAKACARGAELWAEVERHPTDPERHEAFITFARDQSISPWAAMRYRHWLADYPSDELAQAGLARTVANAQALAAAMQPAQTDVSASVKRLRYFLLGVVSLVLVLLLIAAARVFSGASF